MIWKSLALLALLWAAPACGASTMKGDLPRRAGRPLEATPGLETEYGALRTSEGVRLRTILTRPAGTKGRLPAIFLAQWVSCDSIEFRPNRDSILRQLAIRSGMVMIRVERSGNGDSEGPPCSALDYDTEVRHYREALDQLSSHPWVDPGRIIIFGNSLGATTAPLIAEGRKVAGVLVQGGGALTYLERMIAFDRLYLERSGKYAPEAIQQQMVRRIAFHSLYLGGMDPARVEAMRPDLAGVWQSIRGAEPGSHYGRPFAWHEQAAKRNFLAAWAKLEAPVMVVHGEYDQFEPRHGHELIAETVNRLRPGTATFLEISHGDHELSIYPTAEAAYAGEGGERRFDLFLTPVLEWLRKVTR
jgi:pimeloyl-ACP methyl ester carboxylesterase